MFRAGNQYKGILGATQKMLAKQEQEQYRANANVGDCLLYTSPSPRDRTRSRMPSSA